jgi:hypothetical protein
LEAHESSLRSLALTADGSRLATASEKGTVIRVFDVAAASCIQEFRRGVERATITCLAWSWDFHWLCCTSDKGTAHIFHVDEAEEEKKTGESLTQMIFSSVRKSVEGDAKKSVCQIRGVPHPQSCAFVSAATNLVAVAGWDADGNGVLLLSEFKAGEEPKRVGYHVLCKSASVSQDETEEARRRRRLRGWTPEIPQAAEGGRLYTGERLEIVERGMEQITFEESNDDDEFVSVSTVRRQEPTPLKQQIQTQFRNEPSRSDHHVDIPSESQATDEGRSSNVVDSVGDSMRTEPLESLDSSGSSP